MKKLIHYFLGISILTFLSIIAVFFVWHTRTKNHLNRLWYDHPAEEWTEALPVGNGRMGAMVFGKTDSERLQLNEESLWAGQPIDNNNPGAKAHLHEIQQLLLDGDIEKAVQLGEHYLLGTPPRIRSYQTLGDLFLEFSHAEEIQDYRRELDLESGIIRITYTIRSIQFTREIFISAPDNVMVVRLAASKKGCLNVTIRLIREKDAETKIIGLHTMLMTGQIVDEEDSLRGPGGHHMKFACQLNLRPEGGHIVPERDRITIHKADVLTLFLTASTDYDLEKLHFNREIIPETRCEAILEKLQNKTTKQIKETHIQDHRALFNRTAIFLGQSINRNLPTDIRLQKVIDGEEDPELIALYFQYGRYLLMNSSRFPGVLPANLQGIWNPHLNAPWNSDFHVNINLQMNYWPAQVCNLSETVEPLTEFFIRLTEPGSRTAREMYGARGWNMHHLTDPFGRTGLMDGIQWGTSPLAGAWMGLTFWRQFEFTQDTAYLKLKTYPLIKGAVQFILDFLIEDDEGRLVTAPSMSPENSYILPSNGQPYQMTYAATVDIQITKELLNACIAAARILHDEPEFVNTMQTTLERLPMIQIGSDGTIQEWIEDYTEAEPGHRHISHLFGLHPGTQITPETPEMFEAAKKTIERRLAHGGGHTGWSRAWIVNFYARLLDGEHAYHHLLQLLQKSTLMNLFDTHPPFQIDGNFGCTAGIAEMLLQSHNGVIHLLPALPVAWQEGYVKGICARGNFTLDIFWEEGKLKKAVFHSGSGGQCIVRYKDKMITLETQKGEKYGLEKFF
ncbi:glycoside hydrolase family 95 protein [bacterium]|nr:glycoside hydrolase family 95 protein [bacterium]RQV95549.1 MAG: glycoside hydrolase family 95 protein [bacterium]